MNPMQVGNPFPAFFKPHHPLACRNHQALIDTYQVWLLTIVYWSFSKKPLVNTTLTETSQVCSRRDSTSAEYSRCCPRATFVNLPAARTRSKGVRVTENVYAKGTPDGNEPTSMMNSQSQHSTSYHQDRYRVQASHS